MSGNIIGVIIQAIFLAIRALPFTVTLGHFTTTYVAIAAYIIVYFGTLKFPIFCTLVTVVVSAIGYYYAYVDYGLIGEIVYVIFVTPTLIRIFLTVIASGRD